MKLSILNGKIHTDIDLSKKGAEVIDVSDEDANKLKAKTHDFDIETRELVEIPQPEPEPIPEPTEEEIKEAKIQEIEKKLLRKQAMELVGEATVTIADEIKQRAEEVIEGKDISKEEKATLKSAVIGKLK